MPIRHMVDTGKRRVHFIISGNFTMDEVRTNIEEALDHPAYEPGYDVLSDHTNIGEPLTPDQLGVVVSHLKSKEAKFKRTRWAIVTRKPASFGMMRMLEARMVDSPITIRIFLDGAKAEEWLSEPKS